MPSTFPFRVLTLHDPDKALGVILRFLSARAPFNAFKAGDLVRTVHGQIRRNHYMVAAEADRLVGYLGWGVLADALADECLRAGRPAREDELNGQDVVWVFTAAAVEKDVLAAMLAAGKRKYAGKKIVSVRQRQGRTVASIHRVPARYAPVP